MTDRPNNAVSDSRLRQRRMVVQGGFLLLTALLVVAMAIALNVQRGLSNSTAQIYETHVLQDELLHSLRRTLWLGATASRDYLLNPAPDGALTLESQLAPLRKGQLELIEQLRRTAAEPSTTEPLKNAVDGYWALLERLPVTTARMNQQQRYEYIQEEIAPRRNTASDVVREFAVMDRVAVDNAQRAFAATRRASTQQLLFLLGLAVICGAVVSVVSLVHSARLEKAAERHWNAVERAERELKHLSVRLMEVQEEERAKLARELHDEIGQTLATLRLEISRFCNGNVPNVEAREPAARARMLVDRTMQSIRDLSVLLRPSILDDLGLAPALQWLAEDFNARTGVQVQFEEGALPDHLPEALRTCVYRVLQESLHNCEKHAHAANVRIHLEQQGGELNMEVQDDGRGFVLGEGRRAGLGLLGMRERAHALGGSLVVDSAPAGGTTVKLCLPVPVEATV